MPGGGLRPLAGQWLFDNLWPGGIGKGEDTVDRLHQIIMRKKAGIEEGYCDAAPGEAGMGVDAVGGGQDFLLISEVNREWGV